MKVPGWWTTYREFSPQPLDCECGITYQLLPIYWTAVACGSCGRIYERTGPIWYLRSAA